MGFCKIFLRFLGFCRIYSDLLGFSNILFETVGVRVRDNPPTWLETENVSMFLTADT